jgi:hypothetical protein
LYLSETETKLCVKKDGSAFNKKNSFKIDWPLNKKRNTFYLACETFAETNDWINLLNQVTNLNKKEQQQQQMPIKSIIKQQKGTLITGPTEMTTPMAYKQDNKANSAPNSPAYSRNQKLLNNTTNTQFDNKSLNENYYISQQTIRPNFQSQPNLSDNIHQSIYDAFEKPVEDSHSFHRQQQQYSSKYLNRASISNPLLKAANTIDDSLSTSINTNNKQQYKSDQSLINYSNPHLQSNRSIPSQQYNNNE